MICKGEGFLKKLSVADPEAAQIVANGLDRNNISFSSHDMSMLVDDTIWGLSQELSFGYAIAKGYISLLGNTDSKQLAKYSSLVRDAGKNGPTFGSIMATHLVPVIKNGDRSFLKHFLHSVDIMKKKGVYVLKHPLEALSDILDKDEIESAIAYTDLLCAVFSLNLSYNKCKHFSYIIPKSVLSFSPKKRLWQIKQFMRIIGLDSDLAESFLAGMDKGLGILSEKALNDFISRVLDKYKKNKKLSAMFLSLESVAGVEFSEKLNDAAVLADVSNQLSRYIRARTRTGILIRPASSHPEACAMENSAASLVCSDGKCLYLPDEINLFSSKKENIDLYKVLVKLELGYYEFDTFFFDLEKLKNRCNIKYLGGKDVNKNLSDMERFFLLFPVSQLATDLFTIFEHGRLKIENDKRYPGIYRKAFHFLKNESERIAKSNDSNLPMAFLYSWIAIGFLPGDLEGKNENLKSDLKDIVDLFQEKMKNDRSVEAVGELVLNTYGMMEHVLGKYVCGKKVKDTYLPMQTPFGRRLMPDMFYLAYKNYCNYSEKIKSIIEKSGMKVYKSDIYKQLVENNGRISNENIREIVLLLNKHRDEKGDKSCSKIFDLLKDDEDIFSFCLEEESRFFNHLDKTGNIFKYAEWDNNIQDYILEHVRVFENVLPGIDGEYYAETINNHMGLVKRIRDSFELMRPQGISILRQWVEGDMFDYRALLDFAVDRKSGKIPSDRLYIKRVKQHRDVAVLLLLDFSRSTSNYVSGSNVRVIDVEKDAIVLFCEALEVVGDLFSIAGFSGNGRLGVDYFILKDFQESMNDDVKLRINAVNPRRNTRMGAAIRHAVSRLENVATITRLLIIVSDGYPNDSGYKKNYAVEDTRRAILEARSKNIHTKAITINLPGDPRLDDIYGGIHHNVITNVIELPDKLLRMYNALTR